MAVTSERLKAPEAEFYTWSFPGSPIRIRLNLAIVKNVSARLRHGAAAGECGVLVGSAEGSTTVISGTVPVAQPTVADAARAMASVGPKAVGYYRLTEDGGLRLNENDLALAEALFRDPHQVFLLIQPGLTGPASATFYFRDNGVFNGDFPFLEFPFDASLLAQAEKRRAEIAQRPATPPAPPAVAPPPAAPLPSSPAPPRQRTSWQPVVWTFVATLLLLGAGGILWRSRYPSSNKPPSPGQASQSAIGLQVMRQNDDLKVSWDRTANVVANASSGVLSIQDGNTQRVIPLSAGQVQDGSIMYSPMSDHVQMWLTISGNANTAIESVIVVNPRMVASPEAVPPPTRTVVQPPHEADRVEPRVLYLRPFSAPSGKRPAPRPETAVLEEAPPLAAPSAVPAVPAPLLRPALPEAPRTASVRAPSKAPAPPPAPYYPPVAIRQTTPASSAGLRAVIFKPQVVEIRVSIDANGAVVKAEPTPKKGVHQLIVNAALAAAREWRFRPARRGDQPIPSEMFLEFNFKPMQ